MQKEESMGKHWNDNYINFIYTHTGNKQTCTIGFKLHMSSLCRQNRDENKSYCPSKDRCKIQNEWYSQQSSKGYH